MRRALLALLLPTLAAGAAQAVPVIGSVLTGGEAGISAGTASSTAHRLSACIGASVGGSGTSPSHRLSSGCGFVVQSLTFAPTVTAINPPSGVPSGNTAVTISGTQFVAGATVTIGGNAATSVVVVNPATITASTPAGTLGARDVVVTNPDGRSGTLAAGYTYAKRTQSITSFVVPAGKVLGDAPFAISATATSGLAVVFSSLSPTICTVSGSTVSLIISGNCVVAADQPGDGDTLPADQVTRTIPVSLPPGAGTTIGGKTPVGPVTGQTGDPQWVFAPVGTGPMQSGGFIPLSGHPKSPNVPPPADSVFPFGLFDFVAINGAAGTSFTVTITYPVPIPSDARFYKYGRTSANPQPHWYVYPAIISGNTVTITVTDGGAGDSDLVANSVIVDPGGIAFSNAQPVPSLSAAALAALAGLLVCAAALGGRRYARRR